VKSSLLFATSSTTVPAICCGAMHDSVVGEEYVADTTVASKRQTRSLDDTNPEPVTVTATPPTTIININNPVLASYQREQKQYQ